MVSMHIEGMAELQRRLERLAKKDIKRIAGKATRAGTNVIKRQARANAKGMVGGKMGRLLSRYITVGTWRYPFRFGVYAMSVFVSARGNADFVVNSPRTGVRNYIPSAIEYGHAAPYNAKGAKTVAAIPFMRSAFDMKKQEAANAMITTMQIGIEQAAASKSGAPDIGMADAAG